MRVADSDVLIDALRGHEPMASRVADGIRSGSLATTSVSAFELLSGAKRDAERERVEALLGALPILGLDEQSAARAAVVRRALEAGGVKIGMADYLIAGICLVRSATLLTRNLKHFQRVEGLILESTSEISD